MSEEKVSLCVNSVSKSYSKFYSAGMLNSAARILEKVNINVTLMSEDLEATVDLGVDPVVVVTTHGVPDYEATARRAIKYLADGISF
ncbi:hypothetical protein [Paenibacillus sp. 7516]|uniref:hypothetical protein n=1 Tax=Paenibacillus sp. 7516 TaxID=2022549 RepID=UPI000BA52410|nr:hypothetical protein [Paenibacillus sp. 7516]PAF31870.1 hypothetical protein CHI14_09465 [Paenibacillus sp. 7516]